MNDENDKIAITLSSLVLWWVVFPCLLILTLFAAVHVSAQERRLTPQLALARICASEEGWEITDGCAAIHEVIRRGAERRSMGYVQYAIAYSTGVFDGSGRRPWLADLNAAGREPAGWPRATIRRRADGTDEVIGHPRWLAYRAQWLELYEHAGRVVRGEVLERCEMAPDHFGCPPDRRRQCRDHEHAAQRGWIQIDCGQTNSEFWIVPELRD